jgi:hypothetical protein
MQQQVEKVLQKGIIRTSTSPWSAPAIFAQTIHRTENQNFDFV